VSLAMQFRPRASPVSLQLDGLYTRLSGDDFFVQGPADESIRIELEARVGRLTPFVEVRQHIVFLSADNSSFVLVMVGLRF
jgi:hypothetical protein